jgi:copper chaperone CopZ
MIIKFGNSRIFSLALLVLTFCFSVSVNAQTQHKQELIYVKIEIKGMACPYCAFGMEKEFKKVSGVENVEIVLKAGLAYITTPIEQKPTKKSIEKIITDAGFTVGKIEYSDKPYIIKEVTND